MAKRMQSQPGLVEEFIKIVDNLGGPDCKNWSHVARLLLRTCNYQVKSPQKLRRVYESLTGPKKQMSVQEFTVLLKIDIKSRGNHHKSTKEFQEQTGSKISLCRFKETAVLGIRNTLKILVKILGVQRKTLQSIFSKFSYTSIQIMLRASDSKDPDPQIQEIKYYAQLFEKAYFIYAENHHKTQSELFELLKPIMNRKQFRRCIFYLLYVNILKCISQNKFKDEDMNQHPLLFKTIEQNKNIPFYLKVVDLCDRQQKYQMYCTSNNIDQEMCKIYFNQLNDNNNNNNTQKIELKIKKQNDKNLKTVRGRIHQPGDHLFRGWKTVIFQQPEEIEEDKLIKDQLIRQKMQELVDIAFSDNDDYNNYN